MLLYLLALSAALTSWFIIISSNIVHSVFCLVALFIEIAFLLFLITTEFLPLLILGLYAGALAVLFVFVVMMLYIKKVESKDAIKKPLFFFVIGFYIYLFKYNGLFENNQIRTKNFTDFYWNVAFERVNWKSQINNQLDLESIASILYTNYFLYLLIAGLILLVALIGAITLTFQRTSQIKKQLTFQQSRRNFKNSVFFAKDSRKKELIP